MVKRTCLLVSVMILGLSLIASAAQPAKITSHIRRQPLDSTALSAAGYSKRLHILEVEFRNGALYRYLDVPLAVYRDFQSADSKTQYYVRHIKGQYRSFRLRSAGVQLAQK
jgi:hypothetical protein